MDEEIDHLKVYEQVANESLSGQHVLLTGLDMVRAHQRGERVGQIEKPQGRLARLARRKAIEEAVGTCQEIANTYGVTENHVYKIRLAASRTK